MGRLTRVAKAKLNRYREASAKFDATLKTLDVLHQAIKVARNPAEKAELQRQAQETLERQVNAMFECTPYVKAGVHRSTLAVREKARDQFLKKLKVLRKG